MHCSTAMSATWSSTRRGSGPRTSSRKSSRSNKITAADPAALTNPEIPSKCASFEAFPLVEPKSHKWYRIRVSRL